MSISAGRKRKCAVSPPPPCKRVAPADIVTSPATAAQQSEKAQRAVFQITELLEAILLDVPCKDLFKYQRVSRRFRDLVAGSTMLKQKMFLVPGGSPVLPLGKSLRGNEAAGPLTSLTPTARTTVLETCPALQVPCPALQVTRFSRAVRPEFRFHIDHRDLAPASTSTSSLNDLYLTNPPITRATLTLCWIVVGDHGDSGFGKYHGTLEDPAGFTIGRLLEAALSDRRGRKGSWLKRSHDDRFKDRTSHTTFLETIAKLEQDVGGKAEPSTCSVTFKATYERMV